MLKLNLLYFWKYFRYWQGFNKWRSRQDWLIDEIVLIIYQGKKSLDLEKKILSGKKVCIFLTFSWYFLNRNCYIIYTLISSKVN